MSHAWRGGSTRAWRKRRALVLAENQRTNAGRCTLAIPGVCTGPATEVHHVLGKAGGDALPALAASCKACNLHIGRPDRHPASCHCGYGLKQRRTSPQPRRVSRW